MEKAIDRQRVLLRHLQPSPSSSVPGGGSPLISVRGSPRSLSIGDSMDRLGLFSWCALLYPRFTISYRTDMSISCRYGTELYQVYQSSIGPVRAKCIERYDTVIVTTHFFIIGITKRCSLINIGFRQ
ncbi:hypothetical protein GW17_00016123 [Ensete ventricosum]|nr:hypothetical protein GW17_00016123 [Ensete ventricosum]